MRWLRKETPPLTRHFRSLDTLKTSPYIQISLTNAPVAQLDRVPDYESGGRTFESCRVHQRLLIQSQRLQVYTLHRLRETPDLLCANSVQALILTLIWADF
jgi:hypothetical protein